MRIACACFLALLALAAHADDALDDAFEKDVLIIAASRFACHRFDIYLAMSPDQQRRGLMHVRELPLTSGMLFVYDGDAIQSMWMKDTYLPLDIVFVRADGTVSSVARNTEPLSLRSIASTEPVRFVLELNAGLAERLHIGVGSRLIWAQGKE